MIHDRTSIILSLAPFDGHPIEDAAETIAALGVTRIEPALIAGYTDPFDETIFRTELARSMRRAAEAQGLSCAAFSAHVDVGAPGGEAQVLRRLEFAGELGAQRLVTNAARIEFRDQFFRAMDRIIPAAQRAGVTVALENPGDGRPNLMDSGADAMTLVGRFNTPWVTINYDPGNLLTHKPDLSPEQDALHLGAGVASLHVKDGDIVGERLRFGPLGTGRIDYRRILAHTDRISPRPEYSIEIPLRVSRAPGGKPFRDPDPVPIETIREVLERSLRWMETTD